MPIVVEDPESHTDVLKEKRSCKKIFIVDDEADVTISFKAGLEDNNSYDYVNTRIEVYTSNNPVVALSEFKPNFYDLLLVDINMPHMNEITRSANSSTGFASRALELRGYVEKVYECSPQGGKAFTDEVMTKNYL